MSGAHRSFGALAAVVVIQAGLVAKTWPPSLQLRRSTDMWIGRPVPVENT